MIVSDSIGTQEVIQWCPNNRDSPVPKVVTAHTAKCKVRPASRIWAFPRPSRNEESINCCAAVWTTLTTFTDALIETQFSSTSLPALLEVPDLSITTTLTWLMWSCRHSLTVYLLCQTYFNTYLGILRLIFATV